MNRSLSRVVKLLAFCALALAALRPSPAVDAWIDVVVAPTRGLAELAQPVLWIGRRRAHAAEEGLREAEVFERSLSEALRGSQRRFALPDVPDLQQGRSFVHAEVVGRASDDLDEIHLALAGLDSTGVEPGMPVVSGDVFVGRIRAVDEPWPGHARVDLVTGRHFNVGAILVRDGPGGSAAGERGLLGASSTSRRDLGDRSEVLGRRGPDDAVRLVVGGLVAHERGQEDDLLLALRAPSRREELAGLVLVDEDLAHLEPYGREANGFRLGRVVREGAGFGIVPELDYESGLSRVVVVAPRAAQRPPGVADLDPLTERDGWIAARRLSMGDPDPARAGLKLAGGRASGIEPGNAVAFGARILGRVARAGVLTSDVRTLADPGFDVTALAVVDGLSEPLALGRLVSEGIDTQDGRLVFRWSAVVPLPSPAPGDEPWVAADIFTGAGESGVPPGLLIGRALLPRGPGPHRLWLEDVAPLFDLRRVWVRRSHTARMERLARDRQARVP